VENSKDMSGNGNFGGENLGFVGKNNVG